MSLATYTPGYQPRHRLHDMIAGAVAWVVSNAGVQRMQDVEPPPMVALMIDRGVGEVVLHGNERSASWPAVTLARINGDRVSLRPFDELDHAGPKGIIMRAISSQGSEVRDSLERERVFSHFADGMYQLHQASNGDYVGAMSSSTSSRALPPPPQSITLNVGNVGFEISPSGKDELIKLLAQFEMRFPA